ncbi:hypothetical protein K503DRAFT_767329 [Rhizopogon vinicolor AM-OR11-026]|uniref:Uncharacterized protein n=1 Tax=Rhizopogon vinicolor AM-OR11-026 TaxID=1314800 RepID=A0A1B7NAC4_9AGAM|nr:hypothetical protein K503DRAFT_767329 [Rhizopogon vinicolor AM-OR11-026]
MSRGELREWVGNLAASSSEGLEDGCNYGTVAKNSGNTTSSKRYRRKIVIKVGCEDPRESEG